MTIKSILFVTRVEGQEALFDESFLKAYKPYFARPGHLPELPGLPERMQLIVISGYSLQEHIKAIKGLSELLEELPLKLPRLYLLQETDPSLSLVPLKGEQRFFYLRGPLSTRALRGAIDRILAMKPRPMRVNLSSEYGITARFVIRPKRQPSATFLKEIVEISPTGFSFHWDIDAPLIYPGEFLESLELRAHERVFLRTGAKVMHLTPLRNDDGIYALRVGTEFYPYQSQVLEPTDPAMTPFMDDPLVIRAILTDAVERQTDVVVKGESCSWTLSGSLDQCDLEEGELRLKTTEADLPEEIQFLDIISCQFVRDNAQLQFSSVLLRTDLEKGALVFRFPKRLDRLWARSTLRYTFDEDDAPTVIVHTPFSPNTPMVRRISNLSPHGLRFRADAHQDLLLQGMHLHKMELHFPNGPRICVEGEVRYLGPRPLTRGPAEIPCGVRFEGVSAADHHALVMYLTSKNFPKVQDATPPDDEALWKFLRLSGFFTPAKQGDSLGEFEDCRKTHSRMLHAAPRFSRKLVFKEDGRLFGTVSLQQIYRQTWLVHHLCAVRHPREFVPRSLLLFLGEYISKTPEIDYVKMMWRPNNTWSNRMFGRLVHRLHDGEQSVVKRYSYLHRPAGPLPDRTPAEQDWQIAPIAAEDVIKLESYFITQEEFYIMKSEDLIRGSLGLEHVDVRYRALGLFRERKVFAALEGGELLGFALTERSSPGLNLSNLLSTFQVHICTPHNERTQGLRKALIRTALQYYASHGQTKTVALTEDHDVSAYEALGFTQRKEYISWTFDQNIANIYNLYCYYIFRLYERLEEQRRARSHKWSQ